MTMTKIMTQTKTKTKTQTKTNTKCFRDPMYAIFFKSRGFQDFKYDMDVNVNTQFHIFMNIVNLRDMLWYMCENS